MRQQLEQTLDSLRTDYLDAYFFHHSEFGENDERLDAAIETMWQFRADGLVRAMGMRGPHRFALDRLNGTRSRTDKVARFRTLFERIQPDVLAVRDNLLTPQDRSEGIFAFAATHRCGVLINKPLARTAHRQPCPHSSPAVRRWRPSSPETLVRTSGPRYRHRRTGRTTSACRRHHQDLARIALWSCLHRYEHAAVLVGFSTPEQIEMNLTCLGQPPTGEELSVAREIMGRVQGQLDASGEVFVDEHGTEVTP